MLVVIRQNLYIYKRRVQPSKSLSSNGFVANTPSDAQARPEGMFWKDPASEEIAEADWRSVKFLDCAGLVS